ncbi:hypothetical protein OUZ56_033106 [Daphnia magna]|uniref:Uncharacterized protein n=1 Tax=Daphnia magna TaxID=35525 RepID=A0ABR0BA76_9CRUS|nr:hypothetical protein OUZ56_033106 [Daphnia magna]
MKISWANAGLALAALCGGLLLAACLALPLKVVGTYPFQGLLLSCGIAFGIASYVGRITLRSMGTMVLLALATLVPTLLLVGLVDSSLTANSSSSAQLASRVEQPSRGSDADREGDTRHRRDRGRGAGPGLLWRHPRGFRQAAPPDGWNTVPERQLPEESMMGKNYDLAALRSVVEKIENPFGRGPVATLDETADSDNWSATVTATGTSNGLEYRMIWRLQYSVVDDPESIWAICFFYINKVRCAPPGKSHLAYSLRDQIWQSCQWEADEYDEWREWETDPVDSGLLNFGLDARATTAEPPDGDGKMETVILLLALTLFALFAGVVGSIVSGPTIRLFTALGLIQHKIPFDISWALTEDYWAPGTSFLRVALSFHNQKARDGYAMRFSYVRAMVGPGCLWLRVWPEPAREIPFAILTPKRARLVDPLDLLLFAGRRTFEWRVGDEHGRLHLSGRHRFLETLDRAVESYQRAQKADPKSSRFT